MIKRIKIGIILMLVGIGIPLTLMFFQKNGTLFYFKVKEKDKLREAEVKTLNSIYDLSKWLADANSSLESYIDKLGRVELERFLNLISMAEKIDKVNKDINILLNETGIPRKKLPSGQLEEFVYWTEVERSTGIPFNYSIGIGLIFFITGIGIVIVSLIGRKGRTS